jgi:xylan 1,4-beta-xylosidase
MPVMENPFRFGVNTCHAALLLRKDLIDQLAFLKDYCGFENVRCHGIFHDRVDVVKREAGGRLEFHFDTAHRIYDNLLEVGLTPWVELSFLPRELAADPAKEICWYRAHCSEPSSYREWGQLVEAFGRSLRRRYGKRIRQWHVEVWNEPNLVFWQPEGDQFKAYLRLYAEAARALKRAEPGLSVGGPGTARAEWIPAFMAACRAQRLPLDFVSTHLYPGDEYEVHGERVREKFGLFDFYPRTLRDTEAAVRAHDRGLELFWTETNGMHHKGVTEAAGSGGKTPWDPFPLDSTWGKRSCEDTPQAGAYAALLAGTLGQERHRLMWWAASDIYEEWEPDHRPYHGGRGLVSTHGHPKPIAHALHFAHRMDGGRVLHHSAQDGMGCMTVQKDHERLTLAWNYCHPETAPERRQIALDPRVLKTSSARCHLVDQRHGNGRGTWEALGSVLEPDPRQFRRIRAASQPSVRPLPAAVCRSGRLMLEPNAFVLISDA